MPDAPSLPPAGSRAGYDDLPDGPGHVPDRRLSRLAALLLVGLFLAFVLLTLLGM